MLCGRIIAVSLLLVGLSWPAPSCAQTVQRGPQREPQGSSLLKRLTSFGGASQKEVSRGTHTRQTKATLRSPKRSTPVSGKRQHTNTRSKKNPSAENSPGKSSRSMLDKMNVGGLLPSGFFSRSKRTAAKRTKRQPARKLPHPSQRSRNQNRPPNPKKLRGNQKLPSSQRGVSANQPLPVTRRSPDMGSRRGELEAALSELLEPSQARMSEVAATDADSLAITPPAATSSEPLPGFLSEIDSPPSLTPTRRPPTATRSVSKKTASTRTPRRRESGKNRQVGKNAPLDLRLALQKETYQDRLARHVADATTAHDTHDSHQARPSASPLQDKPIEEDTAARMAESSSPYSNRPTPNKVTKDPLPDSLSTTNSGENHIHPRTEAVPAKKMLAGKQAKNRPTANPEINQLREATTLPTPSMANAASTGNPDNPRNVQASTEDVEAIATEDRVKTGLLFSYQQPLIASHVEGPQQILLGRPADYRIVLRNQGETAAESLIVTVRIPAWAEVVDATSSRGIVQKAEPTTTAGVATPESNNLQWRIERIASKGSQTLNLRLVPHRGRSMQLGVSWTLSPVGSAAIVEVQEPKLQMAIGGPDDVLFGKAQRYQLTLSNPGTGVAEDVKIQLVPPGGNVRSATTHQIGSLQPGETRTIDLELTAREAGDLQVQALANAAGNLHAETTKHLFCRKPELELDWRGPKTKYAGTEATYYFRLRNAGTAPAELLQLKLQLPAGVKYVEPREGQSFDAQKQLVTWQWSRLNPQEEKILQVRCRFEQAGSCVMQLTAQTDTGELRDEKTIKTTVIALADLKLEVSDPQGPVAVGDSAIYEIRVANRGTNQAQGVNIVGLFSEGIDPVSVEGAQYSIRDGRVSFRTIKSLPAGRDIILRIHAKATQPGTHLFRAEVICQELDIKLSSEETTRFFQDEFRWAEGSTPYMAERKAVTAPVIRR